MNNVFSNTTKDTKPRLTLLQESLVRAPASLPHYLKRKQVKTCVNVSMNVAVSLCLYCDELDDLCDCWQKLFSNQISQVDRLVHF